MKSVALKTIVNDCNKALRIAEIEDWPGAVNGLQVENNGQVRQIAAAVDGTLATARKAVEQGADLLIVHHGLFWNKTHPWTGRRYELIKFLIEHNLAFTAPIFPWISIPPSETMPDYARNWGSPGASHSSLIKAGNWG